MQNRYILTATDYFTMWVEAMPLRQINTNQVIEFLEHNIVSKFGTPLTLVFDNASYFSYFTPSQFYLDIGLKLDTLSTTTLKGMVWKNPLIKNSFEFSQELSQSIKEIGINNSIMLCGQI